MMKFIVCVLVLVLCSCSPQESDEQPVKLSVLVVTDEQEPVNGGVLFTDGSKAGISSKSGKIGHTLFAGEGDRVRLKIECPVGHTAFSSSGKVVTVRHVIESDGTREMLKPIVVPFVCVPEKKEHVVVIRTEGAPKLPVKLMGSEIGHTDEDGVAHFRISGRPGEEVEISLDTEKYGNLLPRQPKRRLKLPEKRRFLVFEQKFVIEERQRRHKAKRARKKKTPKGPIRL